MICSLFLKNVSLVVCISGVQLTVTSEKFLQTEASSSLHKGKKFRLDESLPGTFTIVV